LRKYLIVALAALTAVAFAAVAYAQTPGAEMTVAVSPSKAGTKQKPKDVTVDLEIVNSDFTQTASRLEIWLPKNVKIDTAGFKKCSVSVLGSRGPSGCPAGSKVGAGDADARAGVNQSANPPVLPFAVNAYVTGKSSIAFHLQQEDGEIVAVAPAKISKASGKYGQKLDVSIPEEPAQQYPAGLYNGLEKLSVLLGTKKKNKSIVVSTGCAGRSHPYKAAITFVANPAPPKAAKVETQTTARCSK
jgi:hypothetical protein